VSDETGELRTLEQNKKFHAMIRDVAEQLTWAEGQMTEDQWKMLFLAAAGGQKVVPNPFDPQKPFIVVNNLRSSQTLKSTMAEIITEIQVFGDERGVKWRDEQQEAA
jgi:hypothetical protein